jgi:hypothetical protein
MMEGGRRLNDVRALHDMSLSSGPISERQKKPIDTEEHRPAQTTSTTTW